MENRVITIARSYGSGGRKMGRLLAKELGYEYYDREILRIASDESGISEELFNQVDERQHLPLFRIAREAYTGEVIPPDSDDFISNENLFRYQAKIIRELASTRTSSLYSSLTGSHSSNCRSSGRPPTLWCAFTPSWDSRMSG